MRTTQTQHCNQTVSTRVRTRVETGGARVWRFDNFNDLPPQAVAQALSRLSRSGGLRRLSKGVYYKSRMTTFGESQPNPASIRKLIAKDHQMFPAGVTAANMLGLTTQNAAQLELATTAQSLPRKLLGRDTVLHTSRPQAWAKLRPKDAAILDILRNRATMSELSPHETVVKLLALLKDSDQYQRLFRVTSTEPPRVRAMLGALGEQLQVSPKKLATLRQSLNPLSKFDFGILSVLPSARDWQAKQLSAE